MDALYRSFRAGGRDLTEGSEIPAGEPVFVCFKKVYCAFYPLTAGRAATLRVERIEKALSLSIVHYEGAEKHMARKALKLSTSGFVCEIRDSREYDGFDDFVGKMSGAVVSDVLYANLHTRFAAERKTVFKRGDVRLECCYSPVSEGIRYIRANGKPLV